jgi:hypothetical protein
MKRRILFLSVLALFCGSLFLVGCKGKEDEKSITETVKDVVGTEVAKKAQEVDKKVNQAMKDEAKRLLPENGNKDQENAGEESKENHE